MPDESSAPETVGADRPADEKFTWSAAMVVEQEEDEADGDGPEPEARDQSVENEDVEKEDVEKEEVAGESLELDLAAQELAEAEGQSPAAVSDEPPRAASSDRAVELESEHWRERAIVWRERAVAAELVAKMLQRNLDDLRANLEDLRRKVEAAAAADAERTAAIASSESPWRRFVRDMYDKYLR
jgi:hypothetical protein